MIKIEKPTAQVLFSYFVKPASVLIRFLSLFHCLLEQGLLSRALLMLSLLAQGTATAQEQLNNRPEWGNYFEKYEANGTLVVLDQRAPAATLNAFNPDRAAIRLSPASTFKIPHTLFALDSGAIADEFQVFEWDGIERSYAPQNEDQNLRSAIRSSALWVFEIVAKEIGEVRAREYLESVGYGNEDPSTEAGAYWVEGKLAISALEQVEFLRRLFYNELPFQKAHQLLIKDVLVLEAGRDWILRAKTGYQGSHGWWVGWVEWPEGPVIFALNIDTPNGMADTFKREAIAREILVSMGALPQ